MKWAGRLIIAAIVAAVVFVPLALSPPTLNTLNVTVIWGIVGLSIVVLTGWNGQVSLGQFAFVGCGAIMAGNLMSRWNVDFFISLAAAAATGARDRVPARCAGPSHPRAVPRGGHAVVRRSARRLRAQPQRLPRPHPPECRSSGPVAAMVDAGRAGVLLRGRRGARTGGDLGARGAQGPERAGAHRRPRQPQGGRGDGGADATDGADGLPLLGGDRRSRGRAPRHAPERCPCRARTRPCRASTCSR